MEHHENEQLRRLHAWVMLRREWAGMRARVAFDDVLAEVERMLSDAATGQPGDEALFRFRAWFAEHAAGGGTVSPIIAAVEELARRSLAARTVGA